MNHCGITIVPQFRAAAASEYGLETHFPSPHQNSLRIGLSILKYRRKAVSELRPITHQSSGGNLTKILKWFDHW
jgi:hypothetical protein